MIKRRMFLQVLTAILLDIIPKDLKSYQLIIGNKTYYPTKIKLQKPDNKGHQVETVIFKIKFDKTTTVKILELTNRSGVKTKFGINFNDKELVFVHNEMIS